ncbi:MAG: glycoside hydrolase family 97 protein [Bacteroidales bacterium]|nr:glycoside hydrolase family 97 protein [Bacteroidales bacterium]
MRLLKSILLGFFLLLTLSAAAREQSLTLASPDGRLVAHIWTDDLVVRYYVYLGDIQLLRPSLIDIEHSQGGKTFDALTVRKVTRRTIDETVASPFTRQATMRNHCNELTLQMREGLSLVFRAYNEGIAYRFVWEGKPGRVNKEKVDYSFYGDWNITAPYVSQFDSLRHEVQYSTSFESQYTTLPLSQLDQSRLCFLPLMVHCDNGVKVCITESALLDYPGLYLHGTGGRPLVGEHAPLPRHVEQGGHNNLQLLVKEREDYIAEMDRSKVFPWRIMMVGTDTEIAMNNLSYLLAEPSRVDDISWIKPGKVAWEWWNCFNISGVDFPAGVNNDTYKHYIDFASKYGIEYVILDEGWAVNGEADLFKVVPEIDLPMLVQYGRERGVGIILWAGYYAFERDMKRVCEHYSQMGVKGFKIDFMDRDDQLVVDFYRRAAEMCAKYKLLVDFHGAFKPAGFTRTYPNVLNFEGVFGLEQMKWAPTTVDQMRYDCEIPFIRQAAGQMDYTQGAMLNGGKWNYHPCWMEPMSQGTRCHQLALYIVLESPLNMLCDSPTHYEREPDYTRFVASIPTVWDETRVLQGEVGEYIVTARRKGDTWYIGGITNWTERDVEIDVKQLTDSPVNVELYTDGVNAHRKGSDYKLSTFNYQLSTLKIHLAPGGGFVARITTTNN